MNNFFLSGIFLISVSLTACMPVYQVNSNHAVRINMNYPVKSHAGSEIRPFICVDGAYYRMKSLPDGGVFVPYGKRITIKVEAASYFGSTSKECHPSVSFIPKKPEKYTLDLSYQGRYCILSVLRKDPSANLGFSVDETARKGNCFSISDSEFKRH